MKSIYDLIHKRKSFNFCTFEDLNISKEDLINKKWDRLFKQEFVIDEYLDILHGRFNNLYCGKINSCDYSHRCSRRAVMKVKMRIKEIRSLSNKKLNREFLHAVKQCSINAKSI